VEATVAPMHSYRDALQRAFARKRKHAAISPVIASIILIAVTIAVAIAVAGFVFGLFGTFTSTPQVSIVSAVVDDGAANEVVAQVVNTGTQDVSAIVGTLQVGSAVQTCTVASTAIPAGAAPIVLDAEITGCTVAAADAGLTFILTLGFSDGTQATSTGTVLA
jgi:FlaG/FlaF family flagellin (archaellin)